MVLLATDAAYRNKIARAVDWNTVRGLTTPRSFGINAFHGFVPKTTNDPSYQRNMAYLRCGFVRYHNSGMLQDSHIDDGLVDEKNRRWDAAKVKQALTPIFSQKPERLVCINHFPSWMITKGSNLLNADQMDAYAAFCADLVRIVNKDARLGVRYWEVTNEKDDSYFTAFHTNGGYGGLQDPAKPDHIEELITIYNKCATAMKRVDPTILVGGPAATRADLAPFYTRFLHGTAAHLDFYSFHWYATGVRETTDAEIYASAQDSGKYVRAVVAALQKESPKRRVPVFLDEYNISWTWETNDPRMTNQKGGVFDALVMIAAAENGADGTAAWNDRDGIYGKMDYENHLRPAAAVFRLFNTFLVGKRVAVGTDDAKAVAPFAIVNGARLRSLLLVNRSDRLQTVAYARGATSLTRFEVTDVLRTLPLVKPSDPLVLPAHSVTLFNAPQ